MTQINGVQMFNYFDDELDSDKPLVDDSTDAPTQVVPAAKPTGLASVFPGLSMSDLKSQSDDANRNKKILTTAGSILQGFQNVPSAYELLSGKKMERPDVAGSLNQIASNIQDPWEKQKKTYELYKGASDAQKSKLEDDKLSAQNEIAKQENDPTSQRSQSARSVWGPALVAGGVDQKDVDKMSSGEIQSRMKIFRQMEKDQIILSQTMGAQLDVNKTVVSK